MFTPFSFIQPLATVTPISAPQYLLIGGSFTTYNTPSLNSIVRLDGNGYPDPSFTPPTPSSPPVIYDSKQQPDGKYLFGGVGSIRLNTDGTRDTTFATSSYTTIRALTPLSDNSHIIVGENFLVKYNSSGSVDATFNVGAGFNGVVLSIVAQSDNKVVVGGGFTTYSGSTVNRIVRLNTNGTIDTTFNIGSGFSSFSDTCNDLQLYPDGKILAVGRLNQYSGSQCLHIIRLNTNGTSDTTYSNAYNAFKNAPIYKATIQPDGKVTLIGAFTSWNSVTTNRIIRLNTNGTRDTTFDIGTGLNSIALISYYNDIASTSDNKIHLTSPTMTVYSGSYVGNFIRINPSGTLDIPYGPSTYYNQPTIGFFENSGYGSNINGSYTLIVSGSSVIAGGSFNVYRQPFIKRGIMVDTTGNISSSFNAGFTTSGLIPSGGFNNIVQAWAVQSDSKILAAGRFTAYSQSFSNTSRIVRINPNGTQDTSFVTGTGFNNGVNDFIVQPDGKVIAIGLFTTYSGSVANRIIRLNTDGTRDTTFNVGAGFPANGNALKIRPDGKIVVAGSFTTYSGSANRGIVRINTDGTKDTIFNVGTGLIGNGFALALQPDEKVLVAGSFTSYNGSTNVRIVRINPDGTKDTTFNMGTGLASQGVALALQSDGKAICSYLGTTYSGSTANYLIRINTNGTLDTTFGFYPTTGTTLINNTNTASANTLAIDNNGKIYWGNAFTTYSGSFRPNGIVRLNTNGSVDETFNQTSPNIGTTGKGTNGPVTSILLI